MNREARPRGEEMLTLMRDIYPLCRSITGEGVRETLRALGQHIDLTIGEIATGEPAFDWQVPQEWVIRDAWIKGPDGRKLVDFTEHNLHLVNYSAPVHTTLSRADLEPHLHSLPEHPDWIPYRTTYYHQGWGFCLTQTQRDALGDGPFEVMVDSDHIDGSLSYGEYFLPGASSEEVIFYSHVCHPSLANDNLSGLAVCTFLAAALTQRDLHYSYRFVFAPGTIGSISWMAHNRDKIRNLRLGLVAVLLGDRGPLRYKQTRFADAQIDRIVPQVLAERGHDVIVEPFSPYGYDERQFGSPGIALPVGRLTRSAQGGYPQYHTSADNMDLVSAQSLAESLAVCEQIVDVIDSDFYYLNTAPLGEPQLGRRGLYGNTGGQKVGDWEMAMLWVLNQADGTNSLLDIAIRSGLSYTEVKAAASNLLAAGLLEKSGST